MLCVGVVNRSSFGWLYVYCSRAPIVLLPEIDCRADEVLKIVSRGQRPGGDLQWLRSRWNCLAGSNVVRCSIVGMSMVIRSITRVRECKGVVCECGCIRMDTIRRREQDNRINEWMEERLGYGKATSNRLP